MKELSKKPDGFNRASEEIDFDSARETLLRDVKEYDPQDGVDGLFRARKMASGQSQAADRVIDFPQRPLVT